MTNVYVEARLKGRPDGDPIDDYVVEDHANHVLATFKTQHEAIEWARKNGHTPLVLASGTSPTRSNPVTGGQPKLQTN